MSYDNIRQSEGQWYPPVKKSLRFHVLATYNRYLEVIGWSIWDKERKVNVISTEVVNNRDAIQSVADLLNGGVLVHYVGVE